jgi:hypothetical protein
VGGGEYLLGLILIISGLAISDLVVSLHGVLLNAKRVKWDWLALLAAAYIFLMIVNSWGLSFQSFRGDDVNPPLWQFLELLGQIIPLYLAARAVLPDQVPSEGIDLAEHYASVSLYFWSAVAVTLVLYLAGAMFNYGTVIPVIADRLGATAQLLLMVPLIAFRSRRLHAIIVPLIFAVFCFDHLTGRLFG